MLPRSPCERTALGAVPGAHTRIRVSTMHSDSTVTGNDEGATVHIIARIIALCGVALVLASCAQPGLSCSGNGGTTRSSGALCAGVIPLDW